MLIFSRRANEGVVIGDNISVTVLEVGEDHVRLAVSSSGDSPCYEEHVLYLASAEQEYEELQV